MKKVLFVMPNLAGGGAEKVLVDILNNLDCKKFDITLFLFKKEGVHIDKINKNIKLISIKDKFKLVPGRILYKVFEKNPKLFYKLMIKDSYDTEVAFMEGIATKFIGASKNKNSKKIAWIHIDLFSQHWTNYLFNDKEEENVYSKFNELIFVSNDSKIGFEKLFTTNNVYKKVIYNPIIDEEIIKKSEELTIKYYEFTLTSVGRLSSQKGYDRLIKAHAKLVNKYPHKLVIIGEGKERLLLENMIKELGVDRTVELKGFVNNPYPYIKATDVFVSSSRTEGCPLVIGEAIALEKCIIATKICGPIELLENGKYGLICDNDEEGILTSLETILKDKELVRKYELLSKERKEFLNYRKIIKQIEEIL